MDQTLNNIAQAVGNYNNIPTSITSSVSVVTLVNGLTITKTANKQIWADGNLTYTIVVDNKAEQTYTSPKVTDILDATLIDFVDGSVIIDGQKANPTQYSFNNQTNTLTVDLEDIAVSSSRTITFDVSKK